MEGCYFQYFRTFQAHKALMAKMGTYNFAHEHDVGQYWYSYMRNCHTCGNPWLNWLCILLLLDR